MEKKPRPLLEVFDDLLPERELAQLADRIGSQTAIADLRLQIADVLAKTVALAVSNPHPWREQKRGLKEVAQRATKLAAAVRELHNAMDDSRWTHSRRELMDAAGWIGPDLLTLAAQLDNLALPAKAMSEIRPAPRHEAFTIFVQLIAPVFTAATGKRPSVSTFNTYSERYTGPFVELVESVWGKILLIAADAKLAIEGPRGNVAIGKATQRLIEVMDKP